MPKAMMERYPDISCGPIAAMTKSTPHTAPPCTAVWYSSACECITTVTGSNSTTKVR
jgi:hypothetical protein